MFVLLLLLENPCCDLIDTVVAVEALEGDLAMSIGVEDGKEALFLLLPGVENDEGDDELIPTVGVEGEKFEDG